MAMAEILRDRDQFERRILSKNAGIAETLPVDRPVFLDRAIPDSIAYFRFHGLDDAVPLHLSQKYRYRRVFLMEPVPYHNDPIRLERQAEAGEIARLLEAAYAALGYPLIRVPFLPVNERARFILERS